MVWRFSFAGVAGKHPCCIKLRVVPLPDLLIELGFLRYAEFIDHKRVFPQLEHKGNGYGDGPGKAWARLGKRRKIGGKGKVLHSLRHGGITKLVEHSVWRR